MSINKWGPALSVLFAILYVLAESDVGKLSFVLSEVQWPLLLVVLGFIHGIAVPVRDHASLGMLIAGAALFPGLADNFDLVPVVGTFLNQWVDYLTISMAGYVVASLIHEFRARIFSL
jgi:hypothetical protein